MNRIIIIAFACSLGGCAVLPESETPQPEPAATAPAPASGDKMQLGNFSVSLNVKDIAASRAFYEKLGFKMVAGDQSQKWIVLKNEETKIGLFQGMLPRNTLTFNPGWDSNKNTLPDFQDVRDLQKALKARGLKPDPAADESTDGPAYLMLTDPDGNPILIDQHVPKPKK